MANGSSLSTTGRNVTVYVIGVGVATTGALGLADAIDLPFAIAAVFLIVGLLSVVFVHERWNGPF